MVSDIRNGMKDEDLTGMSSHFLPKEIANKKQTVIEGARNHDNDHQVSNFSKI
jgi:hypothetical protein